MGEPSRMEQVGRDSLVYGIGGVLARGLSFALLPVYTRIFTLAEYGAIELIVVTASLLTAFLVMGLDSAQSFYFFEQKNGGREAQARVVTAILQWRLTWGAVIVILAGFISPLLSVWLFEGAIGSIHFVVAFAGALFTTLMSQAVEVYRLLYRPWAYIWLTLGHSVLAAGAILSFVLLFDLAVLGYIAGLALASLLVGGWSWWLLRRYLDFSAFHSPLWPRLLRFGVPLVPGGLALYVVTYADRWFVQQYEGVDALGLYAVAAKFAMLMTLVVETFRKAWWPVALDAMHADDGPATFREIARLYLGLTTAAAVFLAFIAPWLVSWMAADIFHAAYPLVGILAWQAVLYGLYLILSAGMWKSERTYLAAWLMGCAAVLNVLLNYWWVPLFGAMGAASATVTAYAAWVLASWWVSERYWRIGHPVGTIATQLILAGAASALLVMESGSIVLRAFAAHVVVMLLLWTSLSNRRWHAILERIGLGGRR